MPPCHHSGPFGLLLAVLLFPGVVLLAGQVVYAPFDEVRAALTALVEILPGELKGQTDPAAAWAAWAPRHDREIRARLERGDEDTIVNWLLFGTTYTSRPRALFELSGTDDDKLAALVAARTGDLIQALRTPGTDERRMFARRTLERKGFGVATVDQRKQLEEHLLSEVARVAQENRGYASELGELKKLGDATEEFAGRSRLFRTRGISLDTSIQPSFAVERTLGEMLQRGLIARGVIREVAVLGPGLDFSDKSSGYDFYPQQTLQPFAIIDSLIRLGLAAGPSDVRVTTLDLSPRVNDHLTGAHQRALRGNPYVVRLPLDLAAPWKPDLLAYWNSIGDRIGTVVQTRKPPAIGQDLHVRAVSVSARAAQQVQPEDLDVVVQRLADRRFDLIVATNVFVYYDVLDQALAFTNVEAMLKPGGFLLSNNALLELPESRMRSVGYLTVQYSDRQDDGDHIVWYRRMP